MTDSSIPMPHAPSPIRILVVIPVYNHGKTLRSVVQKTLRRHDAVMVVDDGSTDEGWGAVADLDVHRIRHSRNFGKGCAILSAARKAERLGMTHLVTLDADGQHDPDDLHLFISAIHRSHRAIVVGKRNFDMGYVPSGSRIGRRISNFWLWVQTGRSLGDTQSGYRAYPIAILNALKLRERRYAFENEVLTKAAWAGIELLEVDISSFYPADEERISHFRLFTDNVRLSLLNARLTLRAMFPWPHRKLT